MTTFKEWILETYDRDKLQSISTHGCVSGCANGLIYYHETSDAHDKYEEEIWLWLSNMSEELGLNNEMEVVASFNGAPMASNIIGLKNLVVWEYVEHIAFYHLEEMAEESCSN